MATDRQHMTDGVSASLEWEPTPPKFPCPDCGAETREHGEAPRQDESVRICSAAACRHVQRACEEIERNGPSDERPRFPCSECGRETKVYKAGRIEGAPRERVCSNAMCRQVIGA